jgi:uncharacterized protein YjbI with pentapeptide repeats
MNFTAREKSSIDWEASYQGWRLKKVFMATKKELIDRWKKEPWIGVDKKIYDYCIDKSINAQPGVLSDLKPLLPLLEKLPFQEELKNRNDFRGSSFLGANNMDLSDCDFSYCGKIGGFKDCVAKNAVFDHSRGPLYEVEGTFIDTSFQSAQIGKAWMSRSVFHRCNFAKASLKSAKITESDLRGSSFRNADLKHAQLTSSDLRGCDLRGADLTGAVFLGLKIDKTTDLRGAILYGMFCKTQRDIYGRLVIKGTDYRKATYDETTKYGEDPLVFERELLNRIIREAKKTKQGWAEILEQEAKQCLKVLAQGASFDWLDYMTNSLQQKLNEQQFDEADDLIERVSLSM